MLEGYAQGRGAVEGCSREGCWRGVLKGGMLKGGVLGHGQGRCAGGRRDKNNCCRSGALMR